MHFLNRALPASLAISLLLALAPTQAENNSENKHPPLDKMQWTYDTDPYGSEAIINEKLIRHSGVWIKFKRAPRINSIRNTWVELIHKIPAASLVDASKIRVTYQSERPLIVKLSQQNYGKRFDKGGNDNIAQYQIELPATKQWLTKELHLKDFSLPSTKSINNPVNDNTVATPEVKPKLIAEEIDAIYLVPQMADNEGGEAILQVRAIELLP